MKLHINWKKTIIVCLDILLAAYLVMAMTSFNKPDETAKMCTKVNIYIADENTNGFLSAKEIKNILSKKKLYPLKQQMEFVNPRTIEDVLKTSSFVNTAQCYKTQDGHVCINITQRLPIVRIKSNLGDDYYVDDEGGIMPNSKYTSDLVIATGNIRFDDIAGLETAKEAFREKVVLPFEHPEIYEKFGKKAGGGILLYGLPGTGKTMFAEAASNEVNALFIPVKCSDIKSKWYGESEQKVKDIFKKARKAERAIIFFDEFEAIGAKRTESSDNGNNDLVPQILAEMQGVGSSLSKSTIVVIAATNKPWSIDSAFMRPGRFDEKIYIPLPDKVARKKLFEIQLSKLPVADDLDYDYLVEITEGFNGADIKEVCEKLKMSAIKDSLEKGEEQTIGMDDVKRIENSIKSSVSNEDIVRLELFESSLN